MPCPYGGGAHLCSWVPTSPSASRDPDSGPWPEVGTSIRGSSLYYTILSNTALSIQADCATPYSNSGRKSACILSISSVIRRARLMLSTIGSKESAWSKRFLDFCA